MWSGGRSLGSIAVAGALIASLGTAAGQTPLCNGQHPGNPELIAGTASCNYNEVNGVSQTLIDLSDTSIIRWDHFGLGNSQSSLSFQWSGSPTGNPTVINRVEGWNGERPTHDISGTIQFLDGNLVISNPNSTVHVRGTVAARSLIFATHRLAPSQEQALLNGQAADFTGASKDLRIENGRIVVSEGDAVLAGRSVANSAVGGIPAETAPEIVAENGSVRIFGGENFRLLPSGSERLEALPGAGDGSMSNFKGIRASRDVEIAARAQITNNAIIDANDGAGQVYLRVDGPGGTITNAKDGLIRGFISSSPNLSNDGELEQQSPDAPSPLSTGVSRLRIPPRPGESEDKAETVVLFENAPTTGSASAQRDRARTSAAAARRTSNARLASNTGAPLARGRSFFGLRGGTKKRSE